MGIESTLAGGEHVVDTVRDVVFEHLHTKALERGADGGDPGQDVDAVAALVDHALDAAHLPFDAVQALLERVLVVAVLHQRTSLDAVQLV